MARKSKEQLENMMYRQLETLMKETIKGNFYPSGTRPTDASTEDAVLTVGALDADSQFQTGRAKLNIYVPDINIGKGQMVPDKARIIALSAIDEQVIDTLNQADTDYAYDLNEGTTTLEVPGLSQHIVNINIQFTANNLND